MPRGQGARGKSRATSLVVGAGVPVPDFVSLDPGANEFWAPLASARIPGAWRDIDLIMLAKVANLEAMIRLNLQMLAESSTVILNDKGNAQANPLVAIIESLHRQQITFIRALGLTVNSAQAGAMNKDGKTRKSFTALLDGDAEGFLARPDK